MFGNRYINRLNQIRNIIEVKLLNIYKIKNRKVHNPLYQVMSSGISV